MEFLVVLVLGLSAHAAQTVADDCEQYFRMPITVPADLPRISVSRLRTAPYLLVEGKEALSPANPVKVITFKNKDALLAVDARWIHNVGVERLTREILKLESTAPNANWIDEVTLRFATYDLPDPETKGFASLWGRVEEEFRKIDDLFFLRFFSPVFERMGSDRNPFNQSAVERVALISLAPRASRPNSKITTKFASPEDQPRLPQREARIPAPENTLFQLPLAGTRQVFVTSRLPPGDRILPQGSSKFWDAVVTLKDMHDADSAALARIDVRKHRKNSTATGRLTRFEFTREPSRDIIEVTEQMRISFGEVLTMQAALVQDHLEPAELPHREGRGLNLAFPIFIPKMFFDVLGGQTATSIYDALKWLFADQPWLEDRLGDLHPGSQYFVSSDPDVAPSGHIKRHGSSFIFKKSEEGRIYLVGLINSVQ